MGNVISEITNARLKFRGGGGGGKLVLRESGARWKILRGSRGRLVDPADSV